MKMASRDDEFGNRVYTDMWKGTDKHHDAHFYNLQGIASSYDEVCLMS